MRDLAPDITRQRLIMEGYYSIDVDEAVIKKYFDEATKALGLKMYDQPIVFSPKGEGREENQGYDAFVPLIDSGISLYVWTNAKFLSIMVYSCKKFDTDKTTDVTKGFFGIKELETGD